MTDTTAIAQEQIAYWLEQYATPDEAMVALGYPLWPRPSWYDVEMAIQRKHTFKSLGAATAVALQKIAEGV